MSTRSAHVIGAGFSGMLAAYLLADRGYSVIVTDRAESPGGMIRTVAHEGGDLETAANGFMNSRLLESIAAEIGIKLVDASPIAQKNRYLFIDRLSRWPLSIFETLGMVFRLLKGLVRGQLAPRPMETLKHWGERTLGEQATRKILSTAVLGIYATDPDQLSASLILGRFFSSSGAKRDRPPRRTGTVAPRGGMTEWFSAMRLHLERKGVRFNRSEAAPLASLRDDDLTVIATSAPAAAELLSRIAPELARELERIEMLPIVTATVFAPSHACLPRGFGCLFHPSSGRSSLGVLFSSDIFPHRFKEGVRAETWIAGGNVHPEMASASDGILRDAIFEDRRTLAPQAPEPQAVIITRWPRAFPRYGIELEQTLASLPPAPRGVLLVGNYLGSLGLTQMALRIQKSIEAIAT